MNLTISAALIVASAVVIFSLGVAHLVLTFRGRALSPTDPELETRLQTIAPRLTNETTMWKAWVGFNASHSMGAILFGTLYAHLALMQPSVLFQSTFLSILGGLFLAGYVVLGRLYWFSAPFRGIIVAFVLYVSAYVVRFAA